MPFRSLHLLPLLVAVGCAGPSDTGATGDTGGEQAVDCQDGVCVLSGVITDDLALTADIQWVLRGGVFIGDDVQETVLEIEPGTTIYGESSTDGLLVVRRNATILAEGTAEAPIVFTSSKEPGTRARGDWGGLIVNGNATINACAEDGAGVCEAFGEGGTGWYGGDDDADSSGVLSYVRVEFAGTLVSPDNELNGIAFQGVGSGTRIDHIQVHRNLDDGVEFFGGTAQAKYVLVTGVGDDSLDWTDGWRGKLQHVVLQQYDDASDNGIEADNNGEDNAAEPRSNPTISHLTAIGSPNSEASDFGLLLREGTAASISNAVVVGFGDACLDVDHPATFDQVSGGGLVVERTIMSCATGFQTGDQDVDDDGADDADPVDLEAWFTGATGNQLADPMLVDPYDQADPGFAPGSGSPAASGGVAPSDAFFDDASWIGGVDPSDDWTAGWTTSEAN